MGRIDFPAWLDLGTYGGLACCLLALGGLAAYALGLRRGTPRQLARATLLCLCASALSLASIWWKQARFDLYGPLIDRREVAVAMTWSISLGWLMPLFALVRYVVRARPLPPGQSFTLRLRAVPATTLASLDDPARRVEPLGPGRAWGWLIPLWGELAERPLALTRKLTLLGRETDNDYIVEDERASRHHAEIHWDGGRPHLLDRASLNGILVNGQTVRGVMPLRSGDVVEIGARRYRFELGESLAGADAGMDGDATHKMGGISGPAAARARSGIVLVGLDRGFGDTRWEVRESPSVVGRDPDCQVCLADPSISRRHAQIVRQPSGFFIADLQSSNGTSVNGEPLEAPVLLHSGDLIRVGDVTLRCEAIAVPAVNPSAPTTALEPSSNGHVAVSPSSPSPSAPTAPPAPVSAGRLTAVLRAISGAATRNRNNSPRLSAARLRPSPPADRPDA
jgi:pSer/pThr/pTyr-binding forkhead associated (FHA) protein